MTVDDDGRFVLDLDSNPHPRMLAGALRARSVARQLGKDPAGLGFVAFWHGYLTAMEDATGCSCREVVAWLDRHEAQR